MITKYRNIVASCGGSTYNIDRYLAELRGVEEPPYLINEKITDDFYKNVLKNIGYSKKYFLKIAIDSTSYTEYANKIEELLKVNYGRKVISALAKYRRKDYSLEYEMTSLYGYIESIYTLRMCKKYILHTKQDEMFDFNKLPDLTAEYPIDKYYDKIEDCYIGFMLNNGKYSNVYIRVMKAGYTLSNDKTGKIKNSLNVSVLKVESPNSDTMVVDEFFISKESDGKYIYATPFKNCDSKNCPYKNIINFDMYEDENGRENEIVSRTGCKVSKRKLEWEHCIMSIYEPQKLLSLVAYLWDMYENRKTISRKNSSKRKVLNKAPISIQENIENNMEKGNLANENYSVINIGKYYKYEREKKGWQGGHHKSPVEHQRKGHERIYRNKDGSIKKIVKVKSSTVNKGGKTAIYHIPEGGVPKQ